MKLTLSGAGSVCEALGNAIAFHPSIDFLRWDLLAPHGESKLWSVALDNSSILLFSDNCFYLLRLNILAQIPLFKAMFVLPFTLKN